MIIAYKYIQRALLKGFLVIGFLFLIISIFGQMYIQLKYLGRGGYDFYQLLVYILLLQPSNLYQFFPIIILISFSFVMGRMTLRNELTAFAAMGLGIFDILYVSFIAMVQIVILSVLIGEGIAPYATIFAQEKRLASLYGGNVVSVKGQLWLKEHDWFINIGSITDDDRLHQITRYNIDKDSSLKRIEYAESGIRKNDHWELSNVKWTDLNKANTTSGNMPKQNWYSSLDEMIIDSYSIRAARQPLWTLLHRVMHGEVLGVRDDYLSLIFWCRIFQPILSLILILIAAVIFFDSTRPIYYNKNMAKAISLGLFFYMIKDPISSSFIVLGFSAWFAAIIPFIFGSSCLFYLLYIYLDGNVITRFKERNL